MIPAMALALAALLMAPAQSAEKPTYVSPAEVAKIPRIEASLLLPKLVVSPGEQFSFVLTLSNPSTVPVEVDRECLGKEPFLLRHVPDGEPVKARRFSMGKQLTIAPQSEHREEIVFGKLFGKLGEPGRYRIYWQCRDWRSPVYDLIYGESFDPEKDKVAIVTTDLGVMELALLTQQAPVHVKNFVQLAKAGYYDGVRFYKVVPDIQAETGDVTGTGRGGWQQQIPPEIDASIFPGKGLVGAVRRETTMTSATQFFILLAPAPFHQGKHSFFAYVRKGEDVLDKLNALPVGGEAGLAAFAPLKDVHIEHIEIREK